MKITNNASLPESYWRACAQQRSSIVNRISVTELLSPPQMRALKKAHPNIEIDCADLIDAFFGTAVHDYLAQFADSRASAEQTIAWEHEGWTITGTPDYSADGELIDWKTTRVRALGYDREEWAQQVNLYAHLLGLNGVKIHTATIWAFCKDYDPQKRGEDGYPSAAIVKIPMPLWDSAYAHEYLLRRLRLHQAAEQGIYGECTPAERWQRDTWAVYKKNMDGRAKAVFKTMNEAVEYANAATPELGTPMEWFDISQRAGAPVRCQSWCDVRSVCKQWAAERPNTLLEDLEESVRSIRAQT